MNVYHKFAPNVYLAKCSEKHEKGDIIDATTKHGKENESIVFNLIFERDNFYYYSIIRADGYNIQEHAKKKAERYKDWSSSATRKSSEAWESANEGRDFLILGEPIKVGHHSEGAHRALFKRNDARRRKSIELDDKAEAHDRRAEYWSKRVDGMNLSMPESVEFYKYRLDIAQERHSGLKDGTIEREHGYSLSYANKDLKKAQSDYNLSIKLWGDV